MIRDLPCLAAGTTQGPAIRVLVVEDNANDFELIRACLNEAEAGGAEILHAATVNEALRTLQAADVQLTLLDLALPDSMGMDALERLPLEASGPVIVVTGRESPSLLKDALRLRAYDVLSKQDLTPANLMRLVRLAQMQYETETELRKTEGRFRQVFEHSPDAIFVHTEERVIFANPAAVRMLRADSEAQVVGLSIWKILHPDHHAPSRDRMVRLAAGEALEFQENRYVRFDGTVVDVEVALAPFEFNGRIGIQASARDITERKARAAALREAERFARSTIDAPQNKNICVLDEAGAILTTNKAWREFAGQNGAAHHSAYEGENYLEVCSRSADEDARAVAGGILAVMRGDRDVFEYEYACHSPTEQRWFVARVSRFIGEGPLRLVVAHENVTERKRAVLGTIRMANTYAALSATNEALFRIGQESALFQRVCDIAVQLGGLRLAAIRLIEPLSGWIRPVAVSGEPKNFFAHVPVSIHPDLAEGRKPTVVAARAGKSLVCNDCLADPAFALWHELMAGAGIAATMGIPLRRGGRVIGMLSLFAGERGWFDSALEALFERMAENLSFGLENFDGEALRKETEERLRESEEGLRRFRAALDASADLVVLVDPVTLRYVDVNDTVCRVLGYTRKEMLGLGPLEIFSSTREALSGAYMRLMAGDSTEAATTGTYRCKDGSLLSVEASRTAVLSSQGPVIVSVARDIRQRLRDEEKLRRFRAALDLSADSVFLVDPDSLEIVDCNDGAWRELGYTREELLGATIDDVVVGRTPEQVRAVYARLVEGKREVEWVETTYRRKDGSNFPVEIHRRALVAQQGTTIVVAARNITERKRTELELRRSNERFEIVARATMDVVWDWDLAKDSIWWNSNLGTVFGHTPPGIGERMQSWTEHIHPDDHDRVVESILGALDGGERMWTSEYRFMRADGSYAHVIDRGIVIADEHGKPTRMIGAMADVSERRAAEEKLAYLAQFDDLTGLPNRSLLRDRLAQAVAQGRRRDRSVGVLFVDLDRFKLVNDTLGHHAGDRLIAEVAARLRTSVRDGDTVGRISGDEFGVVLDDMAHWDDAAMVARKILAAFEAPFTLEGNETFVTASIGASVFPADSDDADVLLKNADAAMYSAKEGGRNRLAFYTPELNERSSAKLRLSTELRHAIERSEFLLHYQPKVDLATGAISGFEALLRWQHPVRGLVSPFEFIPVLEDTGLIVPVGEWVLRSACEQIQAWHAAGLDPRPVAVNLSMRQFQQKNLDEVVGGILSDTGINPGMIELELTESALMSDAEETVRVLNALKLRGLRLSVDDFGTGYSSLAYLKRFPIDCLKIDRAFIRDCIADPDDAAIALAVIGLAHTLNLKVVAEGVETEAQLNFLRSHGCDEIQGYYFSRPVPVVECARMLADGPRLRFSAAQDTGAARTILVVDDYKYDRELMREVLEPAGYRVLDASNPPAALELLANHTIDVVISDHSMPGMSGVKFLSGVRQLYPGVLRILFSGSGDASAATDGVNHAGIHKYLSKNWEAARMRMEIREALLRQGEEEARL